jgi:hypothetical protein
MRIRIAFQVLLACVAAACPALVHAQFQDPTPEELKMTADPQAPGAAAVYLYREEETDDRNHFLSYYARVKVLTEKGKELATVHVPYERGIDTVNDIQGRTIHADGTVIPLTTKPADLMDFKLNKFQINTVVFTLPDVEVGSILEYRLKIRSPDWRVSEPEWEIQQPYFVHKAHYSFHPYVAPGHYINDGHGGTLTWLLYATRLDPAGKAKVVYDKVRDTYSLDLADVPAVPTEDWMPPLNTLKWRVEFYYTSETSGGAFWTKEGKHWASSVEDFSKPTGRLRDAVGGIVGPADSDEQKAEKIYAAVMKLENTDFTRKKSEEERKKDKIKEIKRAEDVWKEQSGSADDIALLYVALARAAGLKAYPVQVVNRDRAIFDGNYLSVKQLDDYLALVNLDGKEEYLDPGEKYCPFGRLHWKHTLASGFKLTDKGTVPVTTPAGNYKSAVLSRTADLTLDATGNVKGTVRFVMAGPDALHWRQTSLRNDEEEVKKEFNESIREYIPDGVEADFDHFLGLPEYDSNLIAVVKVSGNVGTATGKRFFLPGLFFESRGKHPFAAEEKRTTPVDVHYPKTEQDEVFYHLPEGFTMESAPQNAKASWPDHAVLSITSSATGDTIKVDRTLLYNYTLLSSEDYPQLHDFYQKVATADQQQLVLTRATVAKGN